MGIISQGKSIWNALFTRTQRQVLGLMFGHPERSFYANEVVRLAGVGTGTVQRELKRLGEAGLLKVSQVGNQVHYQANPSCPVYPELCSFVLKTFAVLDHLREAVRSLAPDLELALLYGDAIDPDSRFPGEVRLLLVADDLDASASAGFINAMEKDIGRALRLEHVPIEAYYFSRNDPRTELYRALSGPHIVLAGDID